MDPSLRQLTADDCRSLFKRIESFTTGGGETSLRVAGRWLGGLRWGRNRTQYALESMDATLTLERVIRAASGRSTTNQLNDADLRACVADAEAGVLFGVESPDRYPDGPRIQYPHAQPKLWFEDTFNFDARNRGDIVRSRIVRAEQEGLSSAGFLRLTGESVAFVKTDDTFRYYPYTTAMFSVTVRDQKARGSGWAGVDFNDWTRINTEVLMERAIDKCIRSRNPMRVEPGRYTTILEPQAVCDLVESIMGVLDRSKAEQGMGPFAGEMGDSKLGEQIIDERLTLSSDPMDPDCGFVPFDRYGDPYTAVNWIKDGVLRELAYSRGYAIEKLGLPHALPSSGAFRLSGGTTSIEEMIATTKRGLLVTRFHGLYIIDQNSLVSDGNTRDGFWLIENGKITKSVTNMRFAESPLFILGRVEQIGEPVRVFRPLAPAVVPALKVKDFNFTGLMDAV